MKSTARTKNYRSAPSRRPVALATFRQQMADYARAERLRELREARHLSREKVAAEVGVSTKTLYSWENGGGIRWENAKELAAFYDVDPESLVSRDLDLDAPPARQGIDLAQHPELEELVNELAQLRKLVPVIKEMQRTLDAVATALEITLADDDAGSPAGRRSQRAPGRRRAA